MDGLWRECDFQRHIFFLDGKTGEYGTLDGIFTGSGAVEEVEYQEGEDLYLFAAKAYSILDDAMGVTYKAYEKVYGAKYYLDGVLVRNFIPCIRKSDNKPGMYDLVNNQFYVNQGTEEFLIGEKITSTRKVKEAFIGINGIAKKVFEASLPIINFTIEGISYQAKEGMTWNEWVFSEYNDINVYTTSESYIVSNGTNSAICLEDGTFVVLEDVIIKNYSYSQQLIGSMPGY